MVRTKKAGIFKAAKAQIAAHGAAAKNGGQQNAGQSTDAAKAMMKSRKAEQNERKQKKLAKRKVRKVQSAPSMWDIPAPANLVARLDQPKVKSKYQSYFEFAENTEKKDKKLEFQVTNDPNPPPGFTFIPFGDPDMTRYCKELSRERGVMIFIVSGSKEDRDKINVHMHRTGYHFRESIVDEARESLGDAVLNHPTYAPGTIEPVPETQEEINRQADAAIKDLFPRIPNTDRQMVLDHAFRKGGLFHGEPMVGLTPDLPLSRRVQLAVLAHIRHTHTRYDKLLKETTWANARKVVEPVCLDIIIKWRGDEETGRDQMDEILREVVIITDSEDEDDSSSVDDSSDEEGEVALASAEVERIISQPNLRNQHRSPTIHINKPIEMQASAGPSSHVSPPDGSIASRTRSRLQPKAQAVKKAQRHGFKRYQAAYDDALHRQQQTSAQFRALPSSRLYNQMVEQYQLDTAPSLHQPLFVSPNGFSDLDVRRREELPVTQQEPHYSQYRQQHSPGVVQQRHEVTVRPQPDHHTNQRMQPKYGAPSNPYKDERPPQVVRRSPQRDGLQDMLAISIEHGSSDATRSLKFPKEGRNGYENFAHRHDSYPRMVRDPNRHSPPGRQVIVIDDDSPQNKRQCAHEDDFGHFRPISSRDYNSLVAPVDSHMLRSSSVQPRYPSARPSIVQTEVQGFSGREGASYPTARAGIPIYDAPEAGYIRRPPEQFRRPEVYDSNQPNGRAVIHHSSAPRLPTSYASEPVYQRPTHRNRAELSSMRLGEDSRFRHIEPEYPDSYTRRPQSPSFPVSSSVSRSYDVGPNRDVVDQGFIQNFSQSRLNGSVYAREGFNAPSEKSRQLPPASMQGQSHNYQDHGARSFTTLQQRRSRSPSRYVESYEREERHKPIVYEEQLHRRPVQHHPSANQPPVFVREIATRPIAQFPLPAYATRQEPSPRPVVVFD